MNRLALGTAQFGAAYGVANSSGRLDMAEAAEVLTLASAGGVSTIDTAISYGASERVLGSLGMESWEVITKIATPPAEVVDCEAWFQEEVAGSLGRLGISQLEAVLFHDPEQLLGARGGSLFEGLQSCKEQGLVRKLGISIYDPCSLDWYLDRFALDIVQSPFSLLDRRLETEGWVAVLNERGIEVHVRSVFLQGVLLMSPEERNRSFGAWQRLWEQLDGWIEDTGSGPLEACLGHVVATKGIDKVIVGVDSSDQMEEILSAFGSEPTVAPDDIQTDDLDLIDPRQWQ